MDKGVVMWFTGVPASGKSTIGNEVMRRFQERGLKIETLDADEVRAHISPDLGYTPEARDMNTKRLGYIASMLARNGCSVVIAAVASKREFRDRARGWVDKFFECYVKTPLEVCQERDPKGLYAKAAEGKVNDIAGMHQPFEEPLNGELTVETVGKTVEECADMVMARLEELGHIPAPGQTASADKGSYDSAYVQHDEDKIKDRLKNLGYL